MRGDGGLVIVRGASYPDANDMHGTKQRAAGLWDAEGDAVLGVEVNTVGVIEILAGVEAPERISA